MNSNPKESINCAWLFPRQEKPNEIKIEFSSFKFPPQLRRERNMKEGLASPAHLCCHTEMRNKMVTKTLPTFYPNCNQ